MSGHVAGLWWPHVDREGVRRPFTPRATRPGGVLDRPGSVGETVQVRRRAAKVVPDYMVPVTVKAVPALPLTVNRQARCRPAAGAGVAAGSRTGGAMTTDLHEIVEFAPQAQFHMLERSGSFGHLEEPDAALEHLRNFWT